MRRYFIAGNWKMFKTEADTRAFFTQLSDLPEGVDVAFAPPFPSLKTAVEAVKNKPIAIYAQNVHWEDEGAFTGEVSAPMLRDIGVHGAIIGHSERRQYFGETDQTVNKRLLTALRHELEPIVCVGENLQQRKDGDALKIIEHQLEGALSGVSASEAINLVLAYEPVWAIGTGETASPEQAQEVHAFIRDWLGRHFRTDVSQAIRLQYGGSVKPENVAALMAQPDIDGALVGGASLEPEKFAKLLQFR